MASGAVTEEHQRVLSRLELKELSLLNWGAVDGSFSKEDLLREIGGMPGLSLQPEAVFRVLCDAQLLVVVTDALPKRYRTRFGETVRLLFKLRQLQRGKPWTDGRHLVADGRIVHRSRQFPKRNIEPSVVRQSLKDQGHGDDILDAAQTVLAGKRLADFQLDATKGILKALETSATAGFVVSAATSGGKSLAFYLPVLSWIADNVRPGDNWVKTLALYPRNELLKDQLSSAYATCRTLDNRQAELGRRPVTVGAYFGAVPGSASDFGNPNILSTRSWTRSNTGYTCPYLRCPKCEGPMRWLHEDIAAGAETLTCQAGRCGYKTPPDTIRLTRGSLVASPPDILFTTTEMMNRNMANAGFCGLFGIGTRAPRVMLLDEIHTNEGTSGANTALLIRRWRHLANASPMVFVGLSATLADPQAFFSALTGLTEGQVISVEPQPQNLENRGAEYLIALRSDPTTGVSPLSTTIQTIMLLRRMLDAENEISGGVIGQRLFAFTDKLDVLNRLYDDFRDAEGRDTYKSGRYNPKALATLRRPNPTTQNFRQRESDGQVWWAPQAIGHNLLGDSQLTVGRTASQDPGVDERDVIIATAALEVGFNDPTVGAVVQHKAPNGAATFLQRKGRAGRTDVMRPYTVVVLSDFGRDRLAYLSYDQLFSPVVGATNLPLKNRYVLRMQATYALIDWITKQVVPPSDTMPSGWKFLSEKIRFDRDRKSACTLIEKVMKGGYERNNLRYFLMNSLGIDDDEVEALFWQAPRSLLLHVLPTLHKQLMSWIKDDLADLPSTPNKPLRDFIPQAMFGDLLVPEVDIEIPSSNNRGQPTQEVLGISQALREFTPGRVNRRYGKNYGNESHWVPVPKQGGSVAVDLPGSHYAGDWLADATFMTPQGPRVVPVFRPVSMKLEKAQGVSAATNAQPLWHAHIIGSVPTGLELVNSPWVQGLVDSIDVYCHAAGGSLEVRRFMTQSNGVIADTIGNRTPFSATFRDQQGEECAMGFTLDADGLRVTLREWTAEASLTPEVLPAMLASWFAVLFERSGDFGGVDVWSRNWLRVVALGAMAKTTKATSLKQAWEEVVSDPNLTLVKEAAQDILGMPPSEPQPTVLVNVLNAFDDTAVVTAISNCVAQVDAGNADFLEFARSRYLSTVAGAFVEAMLRQLPSMVADNVIVDVNAYDGVEADLSFWVTESEAGGSGIIEGFLAVYQADPQMFWHSFERALDPTDLETVDAKVAGSLDLALSDQTVSQAFQAVRDGMHSDLDSYKKALMDLFDILDSHNIVMEHSVSTAVANRLLSAGTSPAHDKLRRELRNDWIAEESRLGLEIDMRSIASKWAGDGSHDQLMGSRNVPSCDRHGFFESLLWPRGGSVREIELELPNVFINPPKPDRLLVPKPPMRALHVGAGRDAIDQALLRDGEVTLTANTDERAVLAEIMKELATRPTDAGFLNVHPRLTSFMRRGDVYECRLELVEVI